MTKTIIPMYNRKLIFKIRRNDASENNFNNYPRYYCCRLIQLPVESPGGRFAVYNSMALVSQKPAFLQWMIAVKEVIQYGANIQLILHLKNLTSKPVNLDIKSPFLAFNQALRKPIALLFKTSLVLNFKTSLSIVFPFDFYQSFCPGSQSPAAQYGSGQWGN